MDKLSKGLKSVDEKVDELKQRFEKFTEEATKIKIGLDKETETLKLAESLVGKLDGEYKRWNEQVSFFPKLITKFLLLFILGFLDGRIEKRAGKFT